jgi:hypothetical protein
MIALSLDIFIKFSGTLNKLKPTQRSYSNFKDQKVVDAIKFNNSQNLLNTFNKESSTSIEFGFNKMNNFNSLRKNKENPNKFLESSQKKMSVSRSNQNIIDKGENKNSAKLKEIFIINSKFIGNLENMIRTPSTNNFSLISINNESMIKIEALNKLPELSKNNNQSLVKHTNLEMNDYLKENINKPQKEEQRFRITSISLANSLSKIKHLYRDKSRDSNIKLATISPRTGKNSIPPKIKIIKHTNSFENNSEETKAFLSLSQFKKKCDESKEICKNNNLSKPSANKSIINSYLTRSRAGNTADGISKTNQDNFLAWPNLLNIDNIHIFGVFDGHGIIYIKKEFMVTSLVPLLNSFYLTIIINGRPTQVNLACQKMKTIFLKDLKKILSN